ncbi:YIP1 family protein [Paenibacillus sp. PR3]|uniref:YIP1 family protein n=1 Tax=Paenibacillus terricola TaxID=2763503 RepID=A0ABR8MUP1_9BACL|nr:YIP1 family protein [Paenibacillus terricola]MBD3919685.1 YIP1 family protein [Paenibacillus terricola]
MASMIAESKYMFHVLLHPFDGFYAVKSTRSRNYTLPTIILLICGLTGILGYQYTGFILNYNPLFAMNSIMLFITTLIPFLLFMISNWSVTTLFDGNGTMGDIYVVMTYALVPKLIFDIIGIILSNTIIQEEAALLHAFVVIGTIWFYFLVFCGLCVIHEYSPLTNVVTLIVTFISAIMIVFLAILYFMLVSKVIGFVYSVVIEWMKR